MATAVIKHNPIDAKGNDLQAGDWIRVISVPISICNMPDESKNVFSSTVGQTFQIESFDDTGCMELDLYRKLKSFDTIWLEPFCCIRTRRYKKPNNKLN